MTRSHKTKSFLLFVINMAVSAFCSVSAIINIRHVTWFLFFIAKFWILNNPDMCDWVLLLTRISSVHFTGRSHSSTSFRFWKSQFLLLTPVHLLFFFQILIHAMSHKLISFLFFLTLIQHNSPSHHYPSIHRPESSFHFSETFMTADV